MVAAPSSSNSTTIAPSPPQQYDVQSVFIALGVFLLSGVLEIGGGWLVWQTLRNRSPWYFALCGSVLLVLYGFVVTLNTLQDFARVYALYGAVFILLSIAWGVALDGFRPDVGDYVGCALVVAGAALMFFWPRQSSSSSETAAPTTTTPV